MLRWGCTWSCSESPPLLSSSQPERPAQPHEKYSRGRRLTAGRREVSPSILTLTPCFASLSASPIKACHMCFALFRINWQVCICNNQHSAASGRYPPQTFLWQAVAGRSLRPRCDENFLYWMRTRSPETKIKILFYFWRYWCYKYNDASLNRPLLYKESFA